MRPHLLSIFKINIITHFPVISNKNRSTLLDLVIIRKKEYVALKHHLKRYGTTQKAENKQDLSRPHLKEEQNSSYHHCNINNSTNIQKFSIQKRKFVQKYIDSDVENLLYQQGKKMSRK